MTEPTRHSVRQLIAPFEIRNEAIDCRRACGAYDEAAQEVAQIVDAKIHAAVADKGGPACQGAGEGLFS